MNPDNKPFLKWFGYSRRERRSTFILLVILMIVIAIGYLAPPKDIEIEDLSGLLASADSGRGSYTGIRPESSRLFNFDPNSAQYDTLTALGLSGKQAGTLISYRKKGGRFYKPSDIKKIYGLDETTADRLIPYIRIEKDTGRAANFQARIIGDQKKTERIDLNRCDSAVLDRLPGLGPVLSSRIIKYRKLLGGYASVEQLKEVYGLNKVTYDLITEKVFADSSLITLININYADFKELSKHPYLDRYEIQSILKYKELKGPITNIFELVDNKVLTADKAKKISPYLKF